MTSPTRLLCVNIDVDALRLYRGIHGLPERPEQAEVYEAGVSRFLDLLDGLGIPGTIFSVSADRCHRPKGCWPRPQATATRWPAIPFPTPTTCSS